MNVLSKLIQKSMSSFPLRIMTSIMKKAGYSEKTSKTFLSAGIIIGLPTPIPAGSVITAFAVLILAVVIGISVKIIKKFGK